MASIRSSLFFSGVHLRRQGIQKEFKVESLRLHKDFCIARLEGISTLSQARALVGSEVWLPEEDLQPLEKGRYYSFQIQGCSVVTEEGKTVGTVKDLLFVQDNDLLVVEKQDREILIPFVASICTDIKPKEKEIVVSLPDGLLDLNEI